MKAFELPAEKRSGLMVSARRFDDEISADKLEDCSAELTTYEGYPAPRRVSFKYEDEELVSLPRDEFDKLVQATGSCGWRQLAEVVQELDITFLSPNHPLLKRYFTTIEANVIRSVFLLYRWLEPHLFNPATGPLNTRLFDQVIMEPWPGPKNNVPYLYLLPRELQEEAHTPALERLYSLNLLGRAEVVLQTDCRVKTWFKPFVVPGVLLHKFDDGHAKGGHNYAFWQKIRSALDANLSRNFSRRKD